MKRFSALALAVDTDEPLPRFFSDSVWCFLLEELPGEGTRLVVSGYATGRPWRLLAFANFMFWEPAHWIMQTRQFANLKRRAERPRRISPGPSPHCLQSITASVLAEYRAQ